MSVALLKSAVICLRESRAKRRAQRYNERAVIEIEKAEGPIKGY